MKVRFSVAILTGMLISMMNVTAWAHTTLHSSTPAANATVAVVPKLVLSFGEPVMLMSIKLTDINHQDMSLNYKSTSSMNKTYTIDIPTQVKDGAYQVQWRILGKDGHNMRGQYSFKVKAHR